LFAATVPNCRAYDPAFAGELAVIFDYGMRRMLTEGVDEFYYLTVMNENYAQPSLAPQNAEHVIRGMYRYTLYGDPSKGGAVRLLGSGTILREVIAAAKRLYESFGIACEVWSVTSFSELAREASETERWNRLNPDLPPRESHVQRCLAGDAPIIAATDYVRAVPQMIASYLPLGCRYVTLGTDGFGRSDKRSALREFFEVDRNHVLLGVLQALCESGRLERRVWAEEAKRVSSSHPDQPSWRL